MDCGLIQLKSVLKRKRKFLDRASLIFYLSPVDFELLIKVQVEFKEMIGLRDLKLRKDLRIKSGNHHGAKKTWSE